MTTEGDREPRLRSRRGPLPSADDARQAYAQGLDAVVARGIDDAYDYLHRLRRRKAIIFASEILVVFVVIAAVAVGVFLLATSNQAAGGLTAGLGTLLSAAYFALDRVHRNIEKTEMRIEDHLTERTRVREVVQLNLIAGNHRSRNDILTDLAAAVTGLVSDTPKELHEEDPGRALTEPLAETRAESKEQRDEGP